MIPKDAINLALAKIVNAPDVATWPVTTALTGIDIGLGVTSVDFTKKNGDGRWPDQPFGDGNLQYTLWLFRFIGGQWVGSAFIQFWFGRPGSGSAADPDVPSMYDQHWYYAERWAPLFGSGKILDGETIGFMVSAGNARDNAASSVSERSNVVLFQAHDTAAYAFPADDNSGTSLPVPPVPVPNAPPLPPEQVVATLADVNAARDAVIARIDKFENDAKGLVTQLTPIAKKLFGL